MSKYLKWSKHSTVRRVTSHPGFPRTVPVLEMKFQVLGHLSPEQTRKVGDRRGLSKSLRHISKRSRTQSLKWCFWMAFLRFPSPMVWKLSKTLRDLGKELIFSTWSNWNLVCRILATSSLLPFLALGHLCQVKLTAPICASFYLHTLLLYVKQSLVQLPSSPRPCLIPL